MADVEEVSVVAESQETKSDPVQEADEEVAAVDGDQSESKLGVLSNAAADADAEAEQQKRRDEFNEEVDAAKKRANNELFEKCRSLQHSVMFAAGSGSDANNVQREHGYPYPNYRRSIPRQPFKSVVCLQEVQEATANTVQPWALGGFYAVEWFQLCAEAGVVERTQGYASVQGCDPGAEPDSMEFASTVAHEYVTRYCFMFEDLTNPQERPEEVLFGRVELPYCADTLQLHADIGEKLLSLGDLVTLGTGTRAFVFIGLLRTESECYMLCTSTKQTESSKEITKGKRKRSSTTATIVYPPVLLVQVVTTGVTSTNKRAEHAQICEGMAQAGSALRFYDASVRDAAIERSRHDAQHIHLPVTCEEVAALFQGLHDDVETRMTAVAQLQIKDAKEADAKDAKDAKVPENPEASKNRETGKRGKVKMDWTDLLAEVDKVADGSKISNKVVRT
jgi:hypothetical protein